MGPFSLRSILRRTPSVLSEKNAYELVPAEDQIGINGPHKGFGGMAPPVPIIQPIDASME
jgi:hypothetical protein